MTKGKVKVSANDIYSLIIIALATYRLAYMLVYEKGPRQMFVRFRERIGIINYDDELVIPDTFLGGLFTCTHCLSLWLSALLFLLWLLIPIYVMPFYIILAISAVTVIID